MRDQRLQFAVVKVFLDLEIGHAIGFVNRNFANTVDVAGARDKTVQLTRRQRLQRHYPRAEVARRLHRQRNQEPAPENGGEPGETVGILAVTGIAWGIGLAPAPSDVVAMPSLPRETLFAFDFSQLFTGAFVTVVLAFLFVDFFDTAGTLIGVGQLGGFLDDEGRLPRANRAFAADALGTTAGAMLGTSTVTSYIESATGIEEGGRTGLTAMVVAALFIGALFFTPLIIAVPAAATAPALVVVGALMMKGTSSLPWTHYDEAIPAFLTIAAMPLTYSIANGIALGIVSYALLKLLSGKAREAHPLVYVLAGLLVLYYGFVG